MYGFVMEYGNAPIISQITASYDYVCLQPTTPSSSCMSYLAPSVSPLQSTERISQGAKSQRRSLHTSFLDDDSLLNVFCLYRPAIFNGDGDDLVHIKSGKACDRERWWYKLAQVCRRWRNLILGSASYLRLCLVCSYGTPVAEMLVHSPPFPLVLDYFEEDRTITVEDEREMVLALEQRDRVCWVRLCADLTMHVMDTNGEFPALEYLDIEFPSLFAVPLSETLQAPRLRHLRLSGFPLPISRFFTIAVGLVTLALTESHPHTGLEPNVLLHWLSFMPQLEKLLIKLRVPDIYVEKPTLHVTLPNLRCFEFQSFSAYVEAVVPRITTPRLANLRIQFFEKPSFSVPNLLQPMNTIENFRFDIAKFYFKFSGYVGLYLREEAEAFTLSVSVSRCSYLECQVSSMAQIFNSPGQIFSTVKRLTLEDEKSYEGPNEVDRAELRKLFRSFGSVRTLHVDGGLVKVLSRCLRLEDGEHPLELLFPELQELTYSGSGNSEYAFTSFIDARQYAGRPVTLMLN